MEITAGGQHGGAAVISGALKQEGCGFHSEPGIFGGFFPGQCRVRP